MVQSIEITENGEIPLKNPNIPNRIIKTKLGDIVIKIPLWDDYFDIFASIPEEITKLPKKETQAAMLKFMGRHLLETWVISPDISKAMKDPKWAVILVGIALDLIEPLKDLMILKKKHTK